MQYIFKTALKLWGLLSTLSMSILLYMTFIVIFNHGGAIIVINEFGEGMLELIIISISLVFAFLGCALLIKDI